MRLLFAAPFLLVLACTHSDSKLDRKVRCATVGRAFIKDLEHKTEGMPTIVDPTYAYNSAADTCLCRYGLYFGIQAPGNVYIIIDTLSNATIATYDASIKGNDAAKQHYAEAVTAMTEDRQLPPSDPAFK
jgi:hypothetical protein